MRTLLASVAVATATFSASAEQLVRVNEAGYFPNGRKRLVLISDEDISGQSWSIVDRSENNIANGSLSSAITGIDQFSPKEFNFKVDLSAEISAEGEYLFRTGSVEKKVSVKNDPYSGITTSVLRWLRSQRSGTAETIDHPAAHMGDSACAVFRKEDASSNDWDNWVEDDNGKILDLQGGWYAGSNYAKFTSAIAYTSYYLLRAYDVNPDFFTKKYSQSQLVDVLDEARFGLSYLLKVMPDDQDFIIEVGGFDSDNGVRLPQDDKMEGKRESFSAFSHPQMGFTAAALAKGAIVFKTIDPTFAAACSSMAVDIFSEAMSESYPTAWLEKGYAQFKDDTKWDNLLLAAVELAALTGEEQYNDKAIEFSNKAKAAYWAGWNMQNMLANSLATDINPSALNYLTDDLDNFAGTANDAANIWGFPMEPTFSSYLFGLGIGIGAARHTEVTEDDRYNNIVENVLDYGFGVNNWGVSFVASRELDNAVKNFNIPIYKLQKHLFPEGAVSLGPSDREGHDGESKWILDDVRVNYCYPFNTESVVFLDHADDYVTMDSWIFGAAEQIYFLALASKMYGSNGGNQ